MQITSLNSPAPASGSAQSGTDEAGRAADFARALQNAFYGGAASAARSAADQSRPETRVETARPVERPQASDSRSTEYRNTDSRSPETRPAADATAPARDTQPAQKLAEKPVQKTADKPPAADQSVPQKPASDVPANEAAAEDAAAPAEAEAPVLTDEDAPAEDTAAAAEAPAAQTVVETAPDAEVILALLQPETPAVPAEAATAVNTDGKAATAAPATVVPATVPVADEAAKAALAAAQPVVAAAEAVAQQAAAKPAAQTETSAAALLAQQQDVTPEEFAAIQQALAAQAETDSRAAATLQPGKTPAAQVQIAATMQDAMQGQAETVARAGMAMPQPETGVKVKIDVQADAGQAVPKTVMPSSLLLALQADTPADAGGSDAMLLAQQANEAAAELQAQDAAAADVDPDGFAALVKQVAGNEPKAAALQPQAAAAVAGNAANAGSQHSPGHLTQAVTPLSNPGTPMPQAAQQVAAQTIARQAGSYLPAGEQVAVQIKRGAAEGIDKISIKLDPGNLGKVEVKMEVGHDGRLTAVIAADKPETLAMLQRDAASLEQSLRDAGLKTDTGSLNFTLRDQGQAGEGRDGQGSGGRGRGQGRDDYADAGRSDAAAMAATAAQQAAAARGGLDIRI